MKMKRKYKQGDRVDSVAELLEHDWFIVHFGPRTTKTMHKAVLWEWKLKTCQQAIDSGRVFIAVKLTNGEYYGHGEKSVYIISGFMRLSREEAMAIRWHMGFSDNDFQGGGYSVGNAFDKFPLAVLLHIADLQATYLDETGDKA